MLKQLGTESSGRSLSGDRAQLPTVEHSRDHIVFSIPRDEVVRALNQTLQRDAAMPKRPSNVPAKARANFSAKPEYSDHPDLVQSLADSAYICDCQGRYAEAERLYRQVLDLSQRRYGKTHVETANGLSDLAAFYGEQGRYLEAEPLLLQLLEVRSQSPTSEQAIGDVLFRLGRLYLHQSQPAKAEGYLQRAVTIFSALFGPQDARTQAAQLALDTNAHN